MNLKQLKGSRRKKQKERRRKRWRRWRGDEKAKGIEGKGEGCEGRKRVSNTVIYEVPEENCQLEIDFRHGCG